MAASPKTRSKSSGPAPEEALVGDLIELLEAGSTPWRKPWDCHTGGVHINLLTGRAYRGSNPILLELGMAMRGAELPFWCGFGETKKLGVLEGLSLRQAAAQLQISAMSVSHREMRLAAQRAQKKALEALRPIAQSSNSRATFSFCSSSAFSLVAISSGLTDPLSSKPEMYESIMPS